MANLNVILHEPEIPANTGNIGRTCVATGTKLNAELTQSFDRYWNSDYAIVVDPNVEYEVKDQANPKP